MGAVYRALDTHLDRPVAVKVLRGDMVADVGRKKRFVQEAKSASALNHPNIIHIYDIDSEGGVDYIAMEYVAGKTLGELIGRKGLRIADALKYAVQITDALATAHAAGIVHRDLKPANLMVNEKGLVKILDFGLAKLTEQADSDDAAATVTLTAHGGPHTEAGTIVGTVAYMSPEQAEGRKVDARSDTFSFGAVLYEMVTARRAFQGETKMSTLSAVLHKEPPPVRELVEGIPLELERIILRCLRKDPARRFQHMADLRVALEEVKEESESGAQAAPVAQRSSVWKRASMALLPLVALGGALGYWWWTQPRREPEVPLKAVPITSDAGQELYPSFSPDGTQVAFSWNGEQQNNFDLWVKVIGPGKPVRLTTAPADDPSPIWSPDGRFLAFLRQISVEKVAVILIPALGGEERQLTEIPALPLRDFLRGPYLAWLPDSRWLVIPNRSPAEQYPGLFLLSVDTLEQRRLTTSQAGPGLGYLGPAVSPDGRSVVFVRMATPVTGGVYLLRLSDDLRPQGEPEQLASQNAWPTSPVWGRQGREIIFCSGDTVTRGLWRIAVPRRGDSPAKPERIPGVGDDCYVLATSQPPQRPARLAYTRELYDLDIWAIERSRPPVRVASSTRRERFPSVCAATGRIAFQSDRSGAGEIWVSEQDGANPVQLTALSAPLTIFPRWSPDCSRIAFSSAAEGQSEIYVVSAGGGPPQRLAPHPAPDGAPRWSRDGRWIYFFSSRGGSVQVWKTPAGGGEAIPVTRGGGFLAVESPDGRFLYYARSDQTPTTLWRVPVEGGEEVQVLDSLSSMGNFDVAADGLFFIPAPEPGTAASIRFLEFATGKITTVATLEKPPERALAVSPDGRRILVTQIEQQNSDLMLIDNFR
jgi:serine/threonine protein kinase